MRTLVHHGLLGLAAVSSLLALVGCAPTRTFAPVAPQPLASQPASLEPGEPGLRPPALALPMHAAAIVGVELLPPGPGEQWRLVSADAEGWVRVWADGRMLAAWWAHRGGVSDVRLDRDGSFYTAGKDGRVLRWPAGATAPDLALRLGRPITALALADQVIGVSDGKLIELWTRDAVPERVWQMQAHGFVAGLELSRAGDIIAAAELRQSALLSGLATHPDAVFIEGEALGLDAEAQASLRAQAELEHPGAVADFVEVWEPGIGRTRELIPQAPIDRDLGIRAREGVVVYREIYDRDNASLVGRRLGDLSSVKLELVKPWAFWTRADGNPDERGLGPRLPAGDFRLGAQEEIVVLDHFPGYASEAPPYGWRVGTGRELAIDARHAALGDDQGNLAVVAWARPAEAGWLAPGEARLDLLAAAGSASRLVTVTLEPRTHYRLWDLDAGGLHHVRVEQPWQVEDNDVPMFPTRLALDGAGERLAVANSSYGERAQLGLRLIELGSGAAQLLFVTQALDAETGLELGLSQDAQHVLAWLPGSPARSWGLSAAGEWQAGKPAFAGAPRFAAKGLWSAHVSGLQRHIVDLRARKALVALTHDTPVVDLGANTLAAIAADGRVAVVQPFGGDVLELIDVEGQRRVVELPGAATALAALSAADAQTVFVIGFADGSIARLDADAEQAVTIHAGAGGRIWELAALASAAGVFVELDEQGLTLHRLADGASLELHLADPASLRGWDTQQAQQLTQEGLVVLWQRGSAQPPCRVLDASSGGVQTRDALERWPRERAAEFFAAFVQGEPCGEDELVLGPARTRWPSASMGALVLRAR